MRRKRWRRRKEDEVECTLLLTFISLSVFMCQPQTASGLKQRETPHSQEGLSEETFGGNILNTSTYVYSYVYMTAGL